MIALYNQYFRFPCSTTAVDRRGRRVAGRQRWSSRRSARWSAVRRAVRIPPAEAMRPEPPARYRRSAVRTPWRRCGLPLATRMVLRNLERQPVRVAASRCRHRVRGGGAVRRLVVHRRDERAPRPAVRSGDAAGCDRHLRRAALEPRRCTTCAPAGRHGCRADARGAGAPPRRPAHANARRSPGCPTPELNRVVDPTGEVAVAAARRPGAVADARRHPRRVAGRHGAGGGARGAAAGARCPRARRWSTTAGPAGLHAHRRAAPAARRRRRRFGRGDHGRPRRDATASTPR